MSLQAHQDANPAIQETITHTDEIWAPKSQAQGESGHVCPAFGQLAHHACSIAERR